MKFQLYYKCGRNSMSVPFDIKKDNDIAILQEAIRDRAKVRFGSDDCYIDDVQRTDGERGVYDGMDWAAIIAPHGYLEADNIDLLLSGDEYTPHKLQFLKDQGFSGDEEELLLSMDTVEYVTLMAGNGSDVQYPENWVDAMVAQVPEWAALQAQMEDLLCDSYFENGFARMLSDKEVNGVFDSSIINGVFIVKWNQPLTAR